MTPRLDPVGFVQPGPASTPDPLYRPDRRWSSSAPSVLGTGIWTWQVQQDGFDRISAAVSIATDNFQEMDTFTGALSLAVGNYTLTGSLPLSRCPGVTASVTQPAGTPSVSESQIHGVLTLSSPCVGPGLAGDFVLTKR